jgi:hypothetical protein
MQKKHRLPWLLLFRRFSILQFRVGRQTDRQTEMNRKSPTRGLLLLLLLLLTIVLEVFEASLCVNESLKISTSSLLWSMK